MRGPRNTAMIAQKKLNHETTKKKKADTNLTKKDKTSSKNYCAAKRPPNAYIIFMEEFRKDYKENYPDNKSVVKDGGAKWKSMSTSEKAPFVEKAHKKKAEYEIALKLSNNNLNGIAKEKSPSTSKSSSDIQDDV